MSSFWPKDYMKPEMIRSQYEKEVKRQYQRKYYQRKSLQESTSPILVSPIPLLLFAKALYLK